MIYLDHGATTAVLLGSRRSDDAVFYGVLWESIRTL